MQTAITRIHDPARALAYFEDKLAFTVGPVELEHLVKAGDTNIIIVDVREAEDYAKSHIPGAINLPRGAWAGAMGLSKHKTNIVYCYTQLCHLAASACAEFAAKGYSVVELEGGFKGWDDMEFDVEHETANRLRKVGERTAHGHLSGRS